MCIRSASGFIKVLIAFVVLFFSICLPGVFVYHFPKGFSFLFFVARNGAHVCMVHSILLNMFELWFYGLMNCLASGTIG